jgi:Protein of unknown function (DUF1761)
MHHLADVNYLAVLVAALAGFVIGGLWYGPLFQKPWMAASGMTKEKGAQSNPVILFGTTYVLNLIMGTGVAVAIGTQGHLHDGLHFGLMVGVFFIATALGIIYLFEQRPLKLFLINAGYQVINLAAIGAIIGAWR